MGLIINLQPTSFEFSTNGYGIDKTALSSIYLDMKLDFPFSNNPKLWVLFQVYEDANMTSRITTIIDGIKRVQIDITSLISDKGFLGITNEDYINLVIEQLENNNSNFTNQISYYNPFS